MRMANLLDTSVSRCNDMWQVALFGRLATSASMCPPPCVEGRISLRREAPHGAGTPILGIS
jgi:hypothetical protein